MSLNSEWRQASNAPVSATLPDQSTMPLGRRTPTENPVWNGWDVLLLFVLAVLMLVSSVIIVALISKLALFPQVPFMKVMSFPLVNFVAQVVAYVALLGLMFTTVRRHSNVPFWVAVRWNWPTRGMWVLILIGAVSYVVLVGVAHLLPWPKKSPFEEFFKRPVDAYAVAVLAISFGPLLEELLFRGFLYPVLAKRVGTAFAVLLTAVPFALIHYPEYASWSPVLIVFLVGSVVTIVRAKTGSVGSSFVVHAVYNGVQMGIAFAVTGGFQHLEKMTQ